MCPDCSVGVIWNCLLFEAIGHITALALMFRILAEAKFVFKIMTTWDKSILTLFILQETQNVSHSLCTCFPVCTLHFFFDNYSPTALPQFLILWDRLSISSAGWLHPCNPPASASWELGLKSYASMKTGSWYSDRCIISLWPFTVSGYWKSFEINSLYEIVGSIVIFYTCLYTH